MNFKFLEKEEIELTWIQSTDLNCWFCYLSILNLFHLDSICIKCYNFNLQKASSHMSLRWSLLRSLRRGFSLILRIFYSWNCTHSNGYMLSFALHVWWRIFVIIDSVRIIIDYRWSSQQDWFSRLSRYGESEKSKRVEMTNDSLLLLSYLSRCC